MNIAFAGLRHDHIYALYDEAKNNASFNITGAYEENAEAKKKAEEKGLNCIYKSYDALLDDKEVEAVALGGCYGDRGEIAVKALKAGKHVIADKPLCTRLSELDRIKKAAEKSGKYVSCMLTMRYSAKFNAARDIVKSGALGEINNIYFGGQHPLMYGRRPDWYFEKDKHGGVINDIAIHAIDIMDYAFGIRVKEINAARCWNKYAKDEPSFKDSAQMMLTAENGAGIIADVSYAIPDGAEFALPYYWKFFVWGTEGTMEFSENSKDIKYFVKGDKEQKILIPKPFDTDYLTDFLKAVNGEKTILSMREVFDAQRTTLKIQEFCGGSYE